MAGITTNTGSNLLYGTNGYLLVNSMDVGATQDSFSIEWSIEQYYPDIAQTLGPVAGTGRVIKGDFRIKVRLLEWRYQILSQLAGSYGVSSDANSETLGGGALGTITEISNVVMLGARRNDDKPFRATIPRAYMELGNIEVNKNKETTLDVTFVGLYTASDPKRMPGYIQFGV